MLGIRFNVSVTLPGIYIYLVWMMGWLCECFILACLGVQSTHYVEILVCFYYDKFNWLHGRRLNVPTGFIGLELFLWDLLYVLCTEASPPHIVCICFSLLLKRRPYRVQKWGECFVAEALSAQISGWSLSTW